jgi:tRNA (guanine37-N1)-methyltransferase
METLQSYEKQGLSLSTLDKSKFVKEIKIKGLKIPAKIVGSCLKDYKDHLLNLPKLPNIDKEFNEDNHKMLLLSQSLSSLDQTIWPENLRQFISSNNYTVHDRTLTLGYDDCTMGEVLEQVIPKNVVIPSGFETVGTIAHLNLRGDQTKYKNIIGQVLLDKNERIKTVVNKTEALSNVFRTPELEIIAGEQNLETEQKEGGCTFKLNIEKVYWCSKLGHERDRMLKLLNDTDTLCDMFCGIGPLSVRAAKKGCYVLANDLNPDCYHYLNINAKINKVQKKINTFNMDAREFLIKMASNGPDLNLEPQFRYFNHIYMNLPTDAVEFLDVFRGFLHYANKDTWTINNLPMVHVYGFESGEEIADIKKKFAERMKKAMGAFDVAEIVDLHSIKDVSSLKKMFCVTFKLSKEVALLPKYEFKIPEPVQNANGITPKKDSEDYIDTVTKKLKN